MSVAMLDQKPVAAVAFAVVQHAHDHPAALQLLAREREFQFALSKCPLWIAAVFGGPETAVPQHDRSAAVLALRNCAFKVAVVEGMVLDLHRQAPVTRIER